MFLKVWKKSNLVKEILLVRGFFVSGTTSDFLPTENKSMLPYMHITYVSIISFHIHVKQ